MQIWVVQWNIHKLSTSLTHYFDANIFYPYPNTFAYHDHLFALGLLGLPIFVLSHNPILTYNVLLIFSFILSAYGMYVLCRELTGNGYAAFLAGLIFGFLPYRFAHLDHLNLLSMQWFPFCMCFLTRYLFLKTRKTLKGVTTLSLFWGFYLLQTLTSFNYLFMLTFAIGIFIVATTFLQWKLGVQTLVCKRSKLKFTLLIVGGCIVGMILFPFVLPYLRANAEMGFQRTHQEAESLSARIQDYFVAPENNLIYGKVTQTLKSPTSPFPREQILFSGILPAGLVFLGILGGLNRKRKFAFLNLRLYDKSSHIDVLRLTCIALLVIAGVLSLGPSYTVWGKTFPLPYMWLYKFVPGFKSMRVPARFGVLVFFAMAVLAAIGAAQLYEYFKRYKWYQNSTLKHMLTTGILAGIILLEYASFPKALSFYPATAETIPPVYRWLAEQPEDIRIVELPLDSAKVNFEYTYYSTFHWKRMINGRSAFIPDGILQIFAEMRDFPSQKTVDLLKSLGIHYVILHTDTFSGQLSETLPDGIQVVQTFGNDLLISVSERTPGVWENSESFQPHTLNIQYYVPSRLRPGEQSTLGVSIQAGSFPFCPLPYEKATIIVEWRTSNQPLSQELREIKFPILFEDDAEFTIPLRVIPPDKPGEYRVGLHTNNPLIMQQSAIVDVTVSSDVPDSRRPGILRAQFLEADIPEVWERGKPMNIRISVKNTGDTIWKTWVADRKHPVGEVHLGVVDWQEVSAEKSLKDSHQQLFLLRGFLPYDVAPGEKIVITMEIKTPDLSGEYVIQFDMVSELIQWFSDQGSQPLTKKIILK